MYTYIGKGSAVDTLHSNKQHGAFRATGYCMQSSRLDLVN